MWIRIPRQWLGTVLSVACLFASFLGGTERVVHAANTTAPVSEGVHVTGADAWHAAGFTGKGIKIGITQDYISLDPQYIGNAKVTTKSFRADGKVELPPGGNAYGTMYAEIVHQMAPDAEIVFAAQDSQDTSFFSAIDWLVNTEHVSVLFFDNTWDGGLLDGSDEEYLHEIRAKGISIVVPVRPLASGIIGSGSTNGHYKATYTDADGDGRHDFTPPSGGKGKNALSMRVIGNAISIGALGFLSPKRKIHITMSWDSRNAPSTSLTLSLVDASGKEVAKADGVTGAIQSIDGTFLAGDYTLRVAKADPKSPDVPFDIFFSGMQAGQIVPEGSLMKPQDSKDVITVGGAYWANDRVPTYVSRGPTQDGRAKPDIVAPDCISSHASAVLQSHSTDPTATVPFCGTVSAIQMAGAIALYLQAYPNATPDDVLKYFQDHARKLPGADGDPNTSGAGRLSLGPPPKVGGP